MKQKNVTKEATRKRLGMTFHRSFTLVRPAISQILQVVSEAQSGKPTADEPTKCCGQAEFRQKTSLGSIYIEAMPRYARGAGLLADGNCLSTLGRYAFENDPSLGANATMWLMHYHLCAANGIGATFWRELVMNEFRTGNWLVRDSVNRFILDYYSASLGREVSPASAKETANAFLGTYMRSDGLGDLRILSEEEKGTYRILQPDTPVLWVFAYALIDFWQDTYADRLGINLTELTAEDGIANIFVMDDKTVNDTLNELQREGIVQVFRTAPPHQLMLLTRDKEMILRKVYAVDATL